jgi:branched-chain amino acid transport system ATP-binding protein
VVAGSNGAGKTTLLRVLSGLVPPLSGVIEFDGERIDGLASYEIVDKGLIQVPEGAAVFPNMTVRENLELGSYRRAAREKERETMEWVYQIFPILKGKQSQSAGALSGGQRQMLAIARGLMSCPKLLMLDEPSAGLSPKTVQGVFDTLKDIVNSKQVAVFLVEQNLRSALKIADKVYILENGAIILEGDPTSMQGNEHVRRAYLGL